jgi:hypothetical protein
VSKSTKTSSTNTIPAWAQGLATGAGNDILNTVQGQQPNLNAIGGQIQGYLPGLGQEAMGQNPYLTSADKYAQNVMGGQYLNSNPYVQDMAKFAGQQAGNAVNSAFSSAGRTGSDANQTDLARGVAQGELAPLMQNYQNERGLQNQAAGMMPGLTAAQFAGIPAYLGAAQTAGTLPLSGLSGLSGIGNLWAGQGTTTQTQPGGLLGGLLGAASNMFSFAPISLSDRRLKTKIVKVGEAKDGLGIYEWNWKSEPDGPRVRGVIADEVKALRPQAYVPNYRGEYAGVNYAALGSLA